jgi:hypothetical protein
MMQKSGCHVETELLVELLDAAQVVNSSGLAKVVAHTTHA